MTAAPSLVRQLAPSPRLRGEGRCRRGRPQLSRPHAGQSHVEVIPRSGSLRKPPLPRTSGERKRRPQASAPFLAPTKWGRGAERSEAERGNSLASRQNPPLRFASQTTSPPVPGGEDERPAWLPSSPPRSGGEVARRSRDGEGVTPCAIALTSRGRGTLVIAPPYFASIFNVAPTSRRRGSSPGLALAIFFHWVPSP